jgi:hypothetical protein
MVLPGGNDRTGAPMASATGLDWTGLDWTPSVRAGSAADG